MQIDEDFFFLLILLLQMSKEKVDYSDDGK